MITAEHLPSKSCLQVLGYRRTNTLTLNQASFLSGNDIQDAVAGRVFGGEHLSPRVCDHTVFAMTLLPNLIFDNTVLER
jgi:hypothetical protein